MKKRRFSIEQITGILKQVKLGAPIAELCRQHGISEQSYYRCKKIYGGMEPMRLRPAPIAIPADERIRADGLGRKITAETLTC